MRRKGGGSYYLRGAVYWVKSYRNGRPYRESTAGTLERDAKDLLNRRLGDIAAGGPPNPRGEREESGGLLVDPLTDDHMNEPRAVRRTREPRNQLGRDLRPVGAGG